MYQSQLWLLVISKLMILNNFKDKPFLIDVSGNLESEKGVKDINKIDKFLNTVHNISS